MRILKEYSALSNPSVLTSENSVSVHLVPDNSAKAISYVGECAEKTNADTRTSDALKRAAGEIFGILAQNAGKNEEVQMSCSYHKYYYSLVFEFSESTLPLYTLNKSVKVLKYGSGRNYNDSKNKLEEIGFMNVVHVVSRISLSVDKITEKMRITIIKEKKYSLPNGKYSFSPLISSGLEICGGINADNEKKTAVDFSERLYKQFGTKADKFMTSPKLFTDNLEAGELEAVFLRDENGNAAGGVVWQKTYGIIVIMVFTVFLPTGDKNYDYAVKLLLDNFSEKANASGVGFIVAKTEHSEIIKDYFDLHDEKYNYKSNLPESPKERSTSYIKPDLMPLIKKSYKNFEMNREIREINFNYNFIEPYSVLTAKIDTEASEAVLSVLLFGDDLKSNILRHIIALKEVGIESIYFRLDLGVPEEAAVSDLIQSCGFEAEYLWPYSGYRGDVIIFTYYGSSAYEVKPCIISPINKSNMDKTPALVRKVYGDNYPSTYLYDPKKLQEKIRKRHVYPYIAIDDEQNALGMIAFVKLSVNPYLFEVGQLMVDPAHRGTNVVNQLIEYIYNTAMMNLDFDAVLSESVTNHKLSQRMCVNSGFVDSALKLNIMSATAFELENERRQIGRMSCVVSGIERADESFTVYLPERYSEEIKFCFEGLKPREYKAAEPPEKQPEGITEYNINDDEADSSGLINITILKIGRDMESAVKKIERYSAERNVKCMLVNIPLNNPYNSYAVNVFKSSGYFFGGIIPYWLPESDAFLMQKLYDNSPDWGSIKLFSRKIKAIAEIIKKDMEEAGKQSNV